MLLTIAFWTLIAIASGLFIWFVHSAWRMRQEREVDLRAIAALFAGVCSLIVAMLVPRLQLPTSVPMPTLPTTMPPPTAVARAAATLPVETPTPQSTSTVSDTPAPSRPAPDATRVREKDGAVMVYVPAGEFIMGSKEDDPDAYDAEQPQHTVYVNGFWIDRTEVTNEQYGLCVAAGACNTSAFSDDKHFNDADQPVVGVSWHEARAYCKWLSEGNGQEYRLPTEAEWEKAARGTDGGKYPWGDAFDGGKLNFCDANCDYDWKDSETDDGYQYAAPVRSYPAGESPYGALDMAGNVWEWTQSLWGEDWYSPDFKYPYNPEDGREDLEAPDSVCRVLRGGSWYYFQRFARCAFRGRLNPGDRHHNLGFRVVASPSPP